jgi:hypothetical protein
MVGIDQELFSVLERRSAPVAGYLAIAGCNQRAQRFDC